MYFNYNFVKWLYFSLLVIMFGSAFVLIEISLKSFSPVGIAFIRVAIAAILLSLYTLFKDFDLEALKSNIILIFILGLTGTTLPFVLISWAQTTINSSETGILIGFMPIFTIIGSHYFFKYESINPKKLFGFILGFFGLAILLLNNDTSINLYSNLMAKLAVVLGAFLYALNALLVKKIKNIKPLQLSAAVMSVSSLQLLVLLGCIDQSIIVSSVVFFDSLIAIIIMSVFSTAIATVIYYRIINNYGPNFLSLVNYPIPIFAFFAGVIFLDEVFNIYSIISLLLVIAAIYISQKY